MMIFSVFFFTGLASLERDEQVSTLPEKEKRQVCSLCCSKTEKQKLVFWEMLHILSPNQEKLQRFLCFIFICLSSAKADNSLIRVHVFSSCGPACSLVGLAEEVLASKEKDPGDQTEGQDPYVSCKVFGCWKHAV